MDTRVKISELHWTYMRDDFIVYEHTFSDKYTIPLPKKGKAVSHKIVRRDREWHGDCVNGVTPYYHEMDFYCSAYGDLPILQIVYSDIKDEDGNRTQTDTSGLFRVKFIGPRFKHHIIYGIPQYYDYSPHEGKYHSLSKKEKSRILRRWSILESDCPDLEGLSMNHTLAELIDYSLAIGILALNKTDFFIL